MAIRISALITYYNEKELLGEALNSVVSQPERPDEILVYDDASQAPAAKYVPCNHPVKVIRGEVNGGLGFARNQLLMASTGDYVHFHDADDLFHPLWSQKVRAALQRKRPDVVLTEIRSFCGTVNLCDAVLGLDRMLESGDLVRYALSGSILAPATTFRRELGLQVGGFRTREMLPLCEDFDFHARLAAAVSTYEVIPEPLVLQRIRPDSLSRSGTTPSLECFTSALVSLRLLVKDLPARYRPELAESAARIGSILFRGGRTEEAREAFEWGKQLGASFRGQRPIYRSISRLVNPLAAEHLGSIYRTMAPRSLRVYLAKLGI